MGPRNIAVAATQMIADWMSWGLYDVVALGPGLRLALVCVALWASMLCNGLEHAIVYGWERFGIHEVDFFQEWAYYLLALLSGVPILSVIGASYAGRIFFQGPINLATGEHVLDEPGGGTTYWGLTVPDPMHGYGRLIQLAAGLVLLVVPFI